MKTSLLIRFLTLVCFVVDLSAGSVQKDEPLLDQSFKLSQNLVGREQLFYLIEFCRVSVLHRLPWEKTHDAATTLFRGASTEKNLESRALGQKNAVTCLSYVDPAAAMEFLPQINFQRQPGQWVYEDHRYTAAEKTFVNFFAKFKSQALDSITAKAKYLGQTGQYPYSAIAGVINALSASSKNVANTLLGDALGFYATESGFYNRDEEFLVLLQALKNPVVDKELATRAVTAFVQHLKKDPIKFPGDYYAKIRIVSTGMVFPFTDRNESFLFQAFPQIRRFNPGLAAQLLQQDSKLRQATGKMSQVFGGFAEGNPTSELAAQQRSRWSQESLVNRIRGCQVSNPGAAVRLAKRLTDPSLRIVGFSAAIPGIARTSRANAHTMFEKQLSDLGNLSDSIGKLQATVALVQAAYHVADSKQYAALSIQAFERGAKFFNSDLEIKRAGRHEGFSELRDLVISTASHPTDILRAKVQNLPDGWLKAYLLLYEAEGHSKPKPSTTTFGPCSD